MYIRLSISLFMLCLLIGCQADKASSNGSSQAATKAEPLQPKISVSETGEEVKQYCYEISTRGNRQSLELSIAGEKVTGKYTINSREKINGSISGFFRMGDIIADFNYELNGKKYEEKIIVTRELTTARVARSGSVSINRERKERNGGQATLETLSQKVCD